jgi:uncharacterized damage-inducible protein DinB
MHQRLAEVMRVAESARAALMESLAGLSSSDWSRRAASGGWSIAQIVGHVQLSEDGSVRALFRAFRDAKNRGLGPETQESSVADQLDRYDIVGSAVQRQAPEYTVPSEGLEPTSLLARLTKTREGLHTWAAEASGFALGDVTFPHPALGTLTLYQWVLFLGHHDRRHQRQIAAILREASAPKRT